MNGNRYVYQIAGTSYESLGEIRAAGFVDATYVSCGGAPGGSAFVQACQAVGMSAIANCGNDGVRCPAGADPDTFYRNLAAMGYQAAGGESCTVQDVNICQKYLPFINYGGEGLVPNQDSYGNLGFPPSSGKGTISYIESYNFPATFVRNDLFNAMKSAWDKGKCPEVGIMIGGWMPVQSDIYIEVAQAYQRAGYKFAGFSLWWGIGTSMWATVQKWMPAIKELQAVFPPTDVQLKDRLAGSSRTAPTPTATVPTGLTISFSNEIPKVGQLVTVSAVLTSLSGQRQPLPNKQVSVSHVYNGVTYQDGTFTTDSNGMISLSAKYASKGPRGYHAEFLGDNEYLGSQSGGIVVL